MSGICTREKLKETLSIEKEIYLPEGRKIKNIIISDPYIYIYKYIKLLRIAEYYHNNSGKINKILYTIYRRRKNRLGIKLGLEIWDNTFGEGLTIYHPGNIVVNGYTRVGKNCKLHGSNCIGNDGKTLAAPVIGDNVRLGVGAKVIGDIHIADNVTIAAGAVVIHSCEIKGATLAGVPAKVVKVPK